MQQEDSVTTNWHAIGLTLLGDKSGQLSIIQKTYPNDVQQCCIEMFSYWLSSEPTASWSQLIEALIQTGLRTAANNIQCKT